MKRTIFTIVLLSVLVMTLSACSSSSDITVGQGDISACLALYGNNVQSWTFSTVEKMANNVCYLYQQSLTSHAQQ